MQVDIKCKETGLLCTKIKYVKKKHAYIKVKKMRMYTHTETSDGVKVLDTNEDHRL